MSMMISSVNVQTQMHTCPLKLLTTCHLNGVNAYFHEHDHLFPPNSK